MKFEEERSLCFLEANILLHSIPVAAAAAGFSLGSYIRVLHPSITC